MPGFSVPTKDSTFGGHSRKVDASATEYYYSYTWQIFQLFETTIDNNALVSLRDTTLPTFTANQDTYVASSLEYKWAKSVTWEDIKVTWYDTTGLINVMRDWRSRIWSQEKGLMVASEYKKRSQIDVYLPTGRQVVTWCLIGSWPKVIRQGELTYTSSDVKLVEVVITYDWAYDSVTDGSIESVSNTCAYQSLQ